MLDPQQYTELHCTLTCEHLSSDGMPTKRTVHREAILVLGRDEHEEITMRTDMKGLPSRVLSLCELVVHRKFASEGKATFIVAHPSRLQLMVSNCPPDHLLMFLRTMAVKMECAKRRPALTERQKMRSDVPRGFTEISPISTKDVQSAVERRHKAMTDRAGLKSVSTLSGWSAATGTPPKAGTPTRKRKLTDAGIDTDKENAISEKEMCGKRKLGQQVEKHSPRTKAKLPINPLSLPAEQQHVLSAVLSGKSLFFTGSAGTGKSYLLKRIIGALPPAQTFATASTGVAACNIGGTTLHAFAGIGSGTASLERCIELASRPVVLQQWKLCKHLVIDEISMVDGMFFDKLETVARLVRKCDKPFGGIQLIVCGDFLQLPPITKAGEKRVYAFQSASWKKCITAYLELKTVHRQSDRKFVGLLQNARLGRCTPEMEECFRSTVSRVIDRDGILATRLCTHKDDVNNINSRHLERLGSESRTFDSVDSVPSQSAVLNSLCPVASRIQLKIGAQVMLTKNLDVQKGLVNGARGVVTGYEANLQGWPVVQFMSNAPLTVKPEQWSVKVPGGAMLQRRQIPLKLAWAISIHKSQGMTLDCVELSLARVFESGQAYVALSRAKSLEGLRVFDFDPRCIHADPVVLQFYRELRASVSADAASTSSRMALI